MRFSERTINGDAQKFLIESFRSRNAESSLTDDLTGLKTEREFLRKLQNEATRSLRYKRPLALLMIDIGERSTTIKDVGQLIYDEILCKAAELLTTSARETDFLGRLKDDVLAVGLPETSAPLAYNLASRISERLIDLSGKPIYSSSGLKISIGLSAVPRHAGDLSTLIQSCHGSLASMRRQRGHCVDRIFVEDTTITKLSRRMTENNLSIPTIDDSIAFWGGLLLRNHPVFRSNAQSKALPYKMPDIQWTLSGA